MEENRDFHIHKEFLHKQTNSVDYASIKDFIDLIITSNEHQ